MMRPEKAKALPIIQAPDKVASATLEQTHIVDMEISGCMCHIREDETEVNSPNLDQVASIPH